MQTPVSGLGSPRMTVGIGFHLGLVNKFKEQDADGACTRAILWGLDSEGLLLGNVRWDLNRQ